MHPAQKPPVSSYLPVVDLLNRGTIHATADISASLIWQL